MSVSTATSAKRLTAVGRLPHLVLRIARLAPIESHSESHKPSLKYFADEIDTAYRTPVNRLIRLSRVQAAPRRDA